MRRMFHKFMLDNGFSISPKYLLSMSISQFCVCSFKLLSNNATNTSVFFYTESVKLDLKTGAIPKFTTYLILSAPSVIDFAIFLSVNIALNIF